MSLQEKISSRKEQLPVYGLGVFMLVAGLSKLLILDFWLGYEPQFIVEILPITARQLTLAGGMFEAVLGVLFISGKRTFYLASVTSLWLLVITFQMASFGLWDLAIRDLGLTLYATSIALMNYSKR